MKKNYFYDYDYKQIRISECSYKKIKEISSVLNIKISELVESLILIYIEELYGNN